MGIGIDLLLDEFYYIEISMSDLYNSFKKLFPEDGDFWWTISQEELNHASLISSVKKTFAPLGKCPSFINEVTFDSAFNESQKLRDVLNYVESGNITREEAFQIAYDFENSVMEEHYQNFMNSTDSSEVDKIFQKLNSCDKDHAERIKNYSDENGLSLKIAK